MYCLSDVSSRWDSLEVEGGDFFYLKWRPAGTLSLGEWQGDAAAFYLKCRPDGTISQDIRGRRLLFSI